MSKSADGPGDDHHYARTVRSLVSYAATFANNSARRSGLRWAQKFAKAEVMSAPSLSRRTTELITSGSRRTLTNRGACGRRCRGCVGVGSSGKRESCPCGSKRAIVTSSLDLGGPQPSYDFHSESSAGNRLLPAIDKIMCSSVYVTIEHRFFIRQVRNFLMEPVRKRR